MDDNYFDDSASCSEPQIINERYDVHLDSLSEPPPTKEKHEETDAMSSLSENLDPGGECMLWGDAGGSLDIDDFQIQNGTVKSEMLNSILSAAIESIAMLSVDDVITDGEDNDSVTMGKTNKDNDEGNNSLQLYPVYKGELTSVYRLVDQDGAVGNMAVKVLTDQFPDSKQISRLENEHNMSKRLSTRCKATRASFGHMEKEGIAAFGDGSHVLFLEWVPGITLSEWLRLHQEQKYREHNLDSFISLSFEIAKSLYEIHEAGEAALGNISAENIIVLISKGIDGEGNPTNIFSVHMIGLGSASPLQKIPQEDGMCFSSESETKIRSDLRSLGEVLFELFSGRSPYQSVPFSGNGQSIINISCGDGDEGQRQIRRSLKELQFILTSSLIPHNITALVLDLMEAFGGETATNTYVPVGSHHYYKSAGEVGQELHSMLVDKECILCQPTNDKTYNGGLLQFVPGRLYGRENQKFSLIQSHNRVTLNNVCEVVLVSGFSGAGKTALVEEALRQPVVERGGHILYIKFDQLHQGEPLAGMISSLAEFCESLVAGNADVLSQTRNNIQEAIGSDLLSVLTEVIPALSKIIGSRPLTEEMKVKGLMAQNQFNYVFQLLVRAFATPGNPTILFIDDLQWADKASLDLLHTLILGSEKNPLMVIECYRDNEIDKEHLFAAHLRAIKEAQVPLTEIWLGNLMRDDVNDLISDALHQSNSQTKSLADVVYRKTSGNALLAIQLIKALWNEGLLLFSFHEGVWKWDTKLIESRSIPDDAAELMARKIMCLSSDVQKVLKRMACVGSQCDSGTLHIIGSDRIQNGSKIVGGDVNVFSMLDVAICEGLIVRDGSKYKFAHDQIQYAAYSIIPEKERGSWHLDIGKHMLESYSIEELEEKIFSVVDQLNRGKNFITENAGRIELAKLNLRAGEKAVSTAAFSTAALFLKSGLALLEKTDWEDNYILCLNLYNTYAETEYCNGNFKESKEMLDCIISNAKCYHDKLHAKALLVTLLSGQGKNTDALELGLDILAEWGGGEPFPRNPDFTIIQEEFLKTKNMLEGKSVDDFLAHKLVDNKEIMEILELLEILMIKVYVVNQMFLPLLTFRLIQLTLRHGVCASFPVGLATYSAVLSVFFNDLKGAHCYGMQSLEIMNRLQVRWKTARLVPGLHTFVFHWSEPLRLSLDPLLKCYRSGLNVGDNEFAFASAGSYCLHSFECGEDLATIESQMRVFEKKAEECKYDEFLDRFTILLKVCNCLGGQDGSQSVNDLRKTLELSMMESFEKGDQMKDVRMCYLQILIKYLFGDYESAATDLERSLFADKLFAGRYCACHNTFYNGLVSAAIARISKKDKWVDLLRDSIKKFKQWSSISPFNCGQKLALLEAEMAFLMNSDEEARMKYDLAVDLATKNRYIQDRAIAHERAGIYYLEKGDEYEASHHYGKAHDSYLVWGAKRKADHLRERCPF